MSLDNLLADKVDNFRFRAHPAGTGAQAVIPPSRSRSQVIPYHMHTCGDRNLVEGFINKIKHFRRIAKRHEKTALCYASMLFLVATLTWLR